MKQTKLSRRIGALMLAIVMVFSVLPMTAFAADDDPIVETTEVIETEAPETEPEDTEPADTEPADTEPADTEPADTEPADTEPADTEPEDTEPADTEPAETEPEETEPAETEPEETVVETTEETVPETTEETLPEDFLDMIFMNLPDAPADGTTKGQPFENYNPSQYYRIPAMVTLNDGTIVAATDARWDETWDGGGLDTIVSRSTDGGENWDYTFANYLGDNGDQWNSASTAFIDPALATDGSTVYMIVDLFPAGYALNGANKQPVAGQNGFTNEGYLRLSKDGRRSYGYYLKGNDIYSNKGEATGEYVDEFFNIGGTNLFCADSPYQVYPTNYLYLTKSTDGGASWSEPTLINVKKAAEQTCLIGPGTGIVTSSGRIMFAVYNYTGGDKNTSVIYSDNGGKDWTRSADMSNQSSEATIVEADGKLYLFARHGGYYVSEDDGTTWSSRKNVGISYDTGCQINALTYSEQIDGKTAILLSAPASVRSNGRIFVGLVNENGTLNWKYTYNVNSGAYSYSCLTELDGGTVALLAETGGGEETFSTYNIRTIAKGAAIGDEYVDPDPTDPTNPPAEPRTEEVYLPVGTSKTFTNKTGDYTADEDQDRTKLDEKIATVLVTKGDTIPGGKTLVPVTEIESGKQYLIENVRAANEEKTGLLANTWNGGNIELLPKATGDSTEFWTITAVNGGYDITNTAGQHLIFKNGNSYTWGTLSQAHASPVTLEYVDGNWRLSQVDTQSNSSAYLNDYQGTGTQAAGWVSPYAAADAGSQWTIYEVVPTTETATTNVKITGVSVGNTTVVVGNVTYNIHVIDMPDSGIEVDTKNSPVVAGEGKGRGKVVTKLNLTEGVNFDLNLSNKFAGQDAVWVSSNDNIVTVDQDGNVHGVNPGETNVLVTVGGQTYSIPVVVHENGSGLDYNAPDTHGIDIIVSEIKDTNVYCSLTADTSGKAMDTNLKSVQEGEVYYLSYPIETRIAFDFFGAPHDGYALTKMSAPGSAGDYMALQDKNDATKCDFYTKPTAAGNNQIGIWGGDAVAAVIKAATDKTPSCDGGMGFTRWPDGINIDFDLSFRSEKLPEIIKEVVALQRYENGEPVDGPVEYEPGMVATIGDEIYFRVTVTKEQYQDLINYTNIRFSDSLNVTLYSDKRADGTYPIIDSNFTAGKTHALGDPDFSTVDPVTKVFYVGYKVQENDLDSIITNTVQLNHTYKSQFSTGSFKKTAKAEASIAATNMKSKSIVVDFGLPVDVTFTPAELQNGHYQLIPGNYKGNYGSATVSGNTVTYTPSDVLLSEDSVQIKVKNTKTNKTVDIPFVVIPASNVLYEAENFMDVKSEPSSFAWSRETRDMGKQNPANAACYGYDDAYETATGTLGSYNVEITSGNTAALTTDFKGNGFDLIGTCGPETGMILLVIKDNDGKGKGVVVDTSFNDSTYGTIHQVPWAHVMMDRVDNYHVEVIGYFRTVSASRSTFGAAGAGINDTLYAIMDDLDAQGIGLSDVEFVYFDNASPLAQMENSTMMTLADDDAAPAPAEATKPVSGGEIVVDGFRVYTDAKNKAYEPANEYGMTYTNVLDAVAVEPFAAYVEANDSGEWTAVDYDDRGYEAHGGPQNEIYLAAGQGIIFTVDDGSNVQISARAVAGPTAWNNHDITSNTEMYYKVTPITGTTFTITNTSGNLLALGNIKSLGDLRPVSEAEVQMVCAMLSASVEPEPPEETDPPTEPEETEPPVEPTFTPDQFNARTNSTKQKNQKQVAVTVTTSTDVAYITVNGQRVDDHLGKKNGKSYVFTYTETVGSKDKPVYEIIAYNADGEASKSISVKG